MKQGTASGDSPKFNKVAERSLGLIESVALATETQPSRLFPGGKSVGDGVSMGCIIALGV